MSAVVEHFQLVPYSNSWDALFYFYYNGIPYNYSYPNSMQILTSPENAAKMEYGRNIDQARLDFLKEVHVVGERQ